MKRTFTNAVKNDWCMKLQIQEKIGNKGLQNQYINSSRDNFYNELQSNCF